MASDKAELPKFDVSEHADDSEHAVEDDAKILVPGPSEEILKTMSSENVYLKSLKEGFQTIRKERDRRKEPFFEEEEPEVSATSSPDEKQQEETLTKKEESALKGVETCAMVNFIDPTTKIASATPAPPLNIMSAQKAATEAPPVIENVYEKLTYIFERDYKSTLRSVPYQRMRSGGNELISSLPVQPTMTGTHTGPKSGEGANVPWGGTAAKAAAPVTEPSEWHNGPFCHVYIAAVSGLDHYRTKVRPSLQAFVSQIEAAALSPEIGGGTAHYLVVYIPTGPKEEESQEETATGRVGTAFANRFQKARKRIANMQGGGEMDESVHSKDSLDSADLFSDPDDPDVGLVPTNLLTKKQRSLYKKICADNPNGKVCVLSLASLDTSESEGEISDTVAIKTQEWTAFNRMLGSVIVSGFKDRCRRYNEELRRLDAQRGPSFKSSKSKHGKRSSTPKFNLAHFFLVKESLAFTFEQMNLPAEALLHYDELRAFLPDEPVILKKSRQPKEGDDAMLLLEYADSGDYLGFRRKLRKMTDLAPVVDTVRRYLFAREIALLVRMDSPYELVSRCQEFTKTMYTIFMRGVPNLSKEEQTAREIEAAKWVVRFSWDVKIAADKFFTQLLAKEKAQNDTMSLTTPGSDYSESSEDQGQSEKAVARQLTELLDVARLFFKQLGDAKLGDENPVRFYEQKMPEDMLTAWPEWDPKSSTFPRKSSSVDEDELADLHSASLLDDAFDSPKSFELKYLELAMSIIVFGKFAERKRVASRLQGQLAEFFIRKGNLKHAARILRSIVKICRWDNWDRCHFWRLFRLAYCQRTTAKATDYLKTLVTCFTPRIAAIAPPMALSVLQKDLEAVMGDALVGEAKYGKLAFLDAGMKVLETSSDESSAEKGPDGKQLIKRYCNVGEKIRISVTIFSHLPEAISLDSLKLFVLAFGSFSTIIENRESVEEDDAFKILNFGEDIALNPGSNKFTIDWFPLSSGQCILSTIELHWRQGFFYYDCMELDDPLLAVDILPSEPTQSLTLAPSYLIPGHDQQVKITFRAGSDVVTAGKIQLSCSSGVELIPPGVDPEDGEWKDVVDIHLDQSKPGETVEVTALVRCAARDTLKRASMMMVEDDDDNDPLGLKATAMTTYLHATSEEDDLSSIPHMKTAQEVFAPILEKTALTTENVNTTWLVRGERAVISVSVLCNTPNPFTVETWELLLPEPFGVSENGDLNGALSNCEVSDGDQLAMAFECSLLGSGNGSEKDLDDPVLRLKLRDNVGKIFTQELLLDLDDLYIDATEMPVSSQNPIFVSTLAFVSLEGKVGEPISMRFTIKCASSPKPNEQLFFSVVWDESNWLVCGKVDGCLLGSEIEGAAIDVLAIPTVSGILCDFPTLSMSKTSKHGAIILHVKSIHPEQLTVLPDSQEIAVAAPNA